MKQITTLVAILAIACFSILGCDTTEPNLEEVGDSESNLQATLAEKKGKPIYPPGKVGTIIIDQDPDELEGAGWSLTGPLPVTGSGDATLTGMFAGEYTLSWTPVPGYSVPNTATLSCHPRRPITFRGTYNVEEPDGFVLIPAGTFQMGSPEDELGRKLDRETLHTVTLTQGFYIANTEVTYEWWDEVMGSGSSTSQLPNIAVSWDNAVAFCNQLSLNEGLTPAYVINGPNGDATWNRAANGYRLPTEAEWEYACRAGSQAAFCNGSITYTDCTLDPNLDQVGWYCGNSVTGPVDVGQKSANAWGLYDMHGNLNEWVWDGYRTDYQNLPSEDPAFDVGPGAARVRRGGVFFSSAQNCRSAFRYGSYPDLINQYIGFRPVRSAN